MTEKGKTNIKGKLKLKGKMNAKMGQNQVKKGPCGANLSREGGKYYLRREGGKYGFRTDIGTLSIRTVPFICTVLVGSVANPGPSPDLTIFSGKLLPSKSNYKNHSFALYCFNKESRPFWTGTESDN